MNFEEKLIWALAYLLPEPGSRSSLRGGAFAAARAVKDFREDVAWARTGAASAGRGIAGVVEEQRARKMLLEFVGPQLRKPCVHCGALAVREGESECLGCGKSREGDA